MMYQEIGLAIASVLVALQSIFNSTQSGAKVAIANEKINEVTQ